MLWLANTMESKYILYVNVLIFISIYNDVATTYYTIMHPSLLELVSKFNNLMPCDLKLIILSLYQDYEGSYDIYQVMVQVLHGFHQFIIPFGKFSLSNVLCIPSMKRILFLSQNLVNLIILLLNSSLILCCKGFKHRDFTKTNYSSSL